MTGEMGMNYMSNPMSNPTMMDMNNMNNKMTGEMGMNDMSNQMMMGINNMSNPMMMGKNNQINDFFSEREKTIIEPYEKKIKDLEEKLKQQSIEIAELKKKSYQKENNSFYRGINTIPKKMDTTKKYTNFEEMLYTYKNCKFNNRDEEKIINDLKEVYYFYKGKKYKKEEENENSKLFLYRFRKAKEMIQIYKIFELITDIIDSIIQYNKLKKNIL